MRFVDLIERKADGGALSAEEIAAMVAGYVDGAIPDYQMAAMLMAIVASKTGKPLNQLRFISIREIKD